MGEVFERLCRLFSMHSLFLFLLFGLLGLFGFLGLLRLLRFYLNLLGFEVGHLTLGLSSLPQGEYYFVLVSILNI
jgi:hypothetical protein